MMNKKEYWISINFKTLNFKEIIVKLNKIQLGHCYQNKTCLLWKTTKTLITVDNCYQDIEDDHRNTVTKGVKISVCLSIHLF